MKKSLWGDRMRRSVICLSVAVIFKSGVVAGQPPDPWTLDRAVAHAFEHTPAIARATARLSQARARVRGAKVYPYNPVVSGAVASRRGGGRSSVDFDVGIAQKVEIAGQRGDRMDAARADFAAQRDTLLREKQVIAAKVHLQFVKALEAQRLLEVAQADVGLAQRLHELSVRRMERGAGTQLDANVAASEFGRSEVRYQKSASTYASAKAAFAEAIGLPPAKLPVPKGSLNSDLLAAPSPDTLLAAAKTNRADLEALRSLEIASRERAELARAEAWPDLSLRGFYSQEAGTDTIIGGGLSIPIPLFARNQGRIDETRARAAEVRAERQAGELSVEQEVIAAHALYTTSVAASNRLRKLVLGTLEQNLKLLQRSFDAGKATWPEVIVIRRSLVDAQRELARAQAGARSAWITLMLASGRMPIPTHEDELEEK